jgi:hypothetical protein
MDKEDHYRDLTKKRGHLGGQRKSPLEDPLLETNPGRTRYWTMRELPYRTFNGYKIPPSLGTDQVYFVLEKLGADNFGFWKGYSAYQTQCGLAEDENGEWEPESIVELAYEEAVEEEKTCADVVRERIQEGNVAFKHGLDLYWGNRLLFDTWVGYVSCKLDNDRRRARRQYYEQVEMAILLFISKDSPVTTQIGISRNYKYFGHHVGFAVHRSLSVLLEAFTARASRAVYPETRKLYMATCLVGKLRELVQGSLETRFGRQGLNKILTVGTDKERAAVREEIAALDADRRYIHKLSGKNKTDIIDITRLKSLTGYTKRHLQNLFIELDGFIDPYELVNDELDNTETTLATRVGSMGLVPADPEQPSFIDDLAQGTWTVHLEGDRTEIIFTRPKWFEHPQLRGCAATSMISIEALSSLFF